MYKHVFIIPTTINDKKFTYTDGVRVMKVVKGCGCRGLKCLASSQSEKDKKSGKFKLIENSDGKSWVAIFRSKNKETEIELETWYRRESETMQHQVYLPLVVQLSGEEISKYRRVWDEV